MIFTLRLACVVVGVLMMVHCSKCSKDKPTSTRTQKKTNLGASSVPKPSSVLKQVTYKTLNREDFNQRAQERFVPLFWRADSNGNGALDVDELVVLVGPWSDTRADYIDDKGFTERFAKTYASFEQEAKPDEATKERHELLVKELMQGKPTLIETDLSQASDEDKALYAHLKLAADRIEILYARQKGTAGMMERIPADDLLSRAVFHRNQSPYCMAPETESNEACTAIIPRPPRVVGLYPPEVQTKPSFCSIFEQQKNRLALMDHFSVIQSDGSNFKAVPYTEVWKEDMEAVAGHLAAAAKALHNPNEAAFKAYLSAASTAFRTNNWEPANETWVAMDATNSKWYARIGPDEVYYEPCAWKAGFALQLARINPESLAWREKLEKVKADMENELAAIAGPSYRARDVQFKLPDFIDVVLNAGDQRYAHGGTIGQSLPNWGAVSSKGGRTVVMTNLYTDADSRASLARQMKSLLCAKTFKNATTDPRPALISVVLHEAAHNLGPSHDYEVKGKKDNDIFGGPLAATLEELKAQTSALYFAWWLTKKDVLSSTEAVQVTVRDLAWAFGHISRGMYAADGRPRNYSQLASIQLGSAFKTGALMWKKQELAANNKDVGCFELDLDKWQSTITALMQRVLQAKGQGDKKAAEKMKADFVDVKDEWTALQNVIAQRWLRMPRATFVYSVKQ